jgi:hypothetical protein
MSEDANTVVNSGSLVLHFTPTGPLFRMPLDHFKIPHGNVIQLQNSIFAFTKFFNVTLVSALQISTLSLNVHDKGRGYCIPMPFIHILMH